MAKCWHVQTKRRIVVITLMQYTFDSNLFFFLSLEKLIVNDSLHTYLTRFLAY